VKQRRGRAPIITSPFGGEVGLRSNPGEGALLVAPTFNADAVTRDYFVAEDDGGRRFWLFREGLYVEGVQPSWFLHGFFA